VRRRPALALPLAVAALLLAACGGASSGGGTTPAASTSGGLSGEITVLAAASLTGSFQTLGKQFQEANPGTTVTFSFGASSALVTQITQGAPADVFASASQKNMDAVVAAKAATTSTPFVRNVMEIAVPPANPAQVAQLSDLAKPGVKVALCQAEAPCGATAAKVFANAKLTVKPVTEEADVKATLAKVSLGEVDAGVVYVTDVLAAGDSVKGIEIPADVNASTTYPIAPLTASKNAALAQAFVDYVLSAEGQKVLTAAGFQAP
jgi:molybdate transport system substrate-binding protein